MSISDKNALPIRPRMDVYVGLADYITDWNVDLIFQAGTRRITASWPSSAPGGYGFGYPTGMSGNWTSSFSVDISEATGQTIQGLFIVTEYTGGGWTVGWDGADEEELAPIMYMTMQTDSDRLRFYGGGSGSWISRIWIIPVTNQSLVFGNDRLTNVTLDLAGSIDVYAPAYEVSSIEASAYVEGINLDLLANMPEKTPIVYMSGYAGDEMSFPRFFYMSEAPEYEKNLLKISGEDASAIMDSYTVPAEVFQFGSGNGLTVFYDKIKTILSDAGIGLATSQASPTVYSSSTEARAIIKEQTARELMAFVMAYCRYMIDDTGNQLHAFRPTFVDAGRPVLRWSYYDADSPDYGPFDLYESDVGDLKRSIDRDVKTLKSDDDFGLRSRVSDESATASTIASVAVRNGKTYKQTFQDYYRNVAVTRSTTPRKYTATSATWKAASAGNSVISGVLQDIEIDFSTLNNSGVTRGREITVTPKIYGYFTQYIDNGSAQLGYVPNYYQPFNQLPEHGSFTWRGNPLMQPRDPFYFHRLDNTVEVYTIERIELKHEEGGTSATIHYRKGVC